MDNSRSANSFGVCDSSAVLINHDKPGPRRVHNSESTCSSSSTPSTGKKRRIFGRKKSHSAYSGKTSFCNVKGENLLVILTVVGVVLGVALGLGIRAADPSDDVITLVMFPGELLMRMLKMLIIPIIVTSIVTGLANMDVGSSGRMGLHAITYYMATTTLAVILGIILVTTIHPGHPDYKKQDVGEDFDPGRKISTMDTFLDLIRNLFPENIIAACFQVARTSISEQLIVNDTNATIVTDNNATTRMPVFGKVKVHKKLEYTNSTNVLGIIVFFVFFGITLSRLGEQGRPVAKIFSVFNDIFMKMIMVVIWYSPVGICSLIAGNLLKLESVSDIIETLGMYIVTVCVGLLIHGLIVLPLIFFVVTRRNPFTFYRGVLQAFLTAVGTASSAGTLPITMQCLENNLKIDKRVTQFVLPLGATMNMDGTALLEGVAAITIAQMYGESLTFGNIVTISVTATFASIGAAAIPSAGLITLILVLTAIGLPADAVGILWSIDWFLDRLRTGLNVLGDCVGAGIVQHLNQTQLERHLPDINIKSSREDDISYEKEKTEINEIGDSGLSMMSSQLNDTELV